MMILFKTLNIIIITIITVVTIGNNCNNNNINNYTIQEYAFYDRCREAPTKRLLQSSGKRCDIKKYNLNKIIKLYRMRRTAGVTIFQKKK